jgi:hypothetical protein
MTACCRVADQFPAIADPLSGNCRNRIRQLPAPRQRSAMGFVKYLISAWSEAEVVKSLKSFSCRLPVSPSKRAFLPTPFSRMGRPVLKWPLSAVAAVLQPVEGSLLGIAR